MVNTKIDLLKSLGNKPDNLCVVRLSTSMWSDKRGTPEENPYIFA